MLDHPGHVLMRLTSQATNIRTAPVHCKGVNTVAALPPAIKWIRDFCVHSDDLFTLGMSHFGHFVGLDICLCVSANSDKNTVRHPRESDGGIIDGICVWLVLP